MDSKRAAESDYETAFLNATGRKALEAWAWVERMGVSPTPQGNEWFVMGHTPKSGYVDGIGPTPLAAVLDAMEKEVKG